MERKRPFPDPSILLHPQIPKPLHLLNPRTILSEDWWNIERQKAYTKNDYCCYACGINKKDAKFHQWLEAHEMYSINYKTGKVEFKEIVALCYMCHNYIHKGRMQILVSTGKFNPNEYHQIINRGDDILKKAKLEIKEPKSSCSWEKWHLIINGKRYEQRFKSYVEWELYWKNNNK